MFSTGYIISVIIIVVAILAVIRLDIIGVGFFDVLYKKTRHSFSQKA